MAYKLGLLLSMAFIMSVLLLSGDLLALSSIHSHLDSMALTVAYRISLDGRVSPKTLDWIGSEKVKFHAVTSGAPAIGDTFVFELIKEFEPLILDKTTMSICVRRSTVVGFYRHS